MKNEYDQLGKRIDVLDTRIENLNSGKFKALTNPHFFENLNLVGVKKVLTDKPVVKKIEKDKTKGLFVTVGQGGIILTSSDGTSWTKRTSGTRMSLSRVTYGNGLFVTVGQVGIILTSSDGITWAERNSGTYNLTDFIWSQ